MMKALFIILLSVIVLAGTDQSSAAVYEMNCSDDTYRLVNRFYKKALYERIDGEWIELKSFNKKNCVEDCYSKISIFKDSARKDYFSMHKIDGVWTDNDEPLYLIYDFYKNTLFISFSDRTFSCKKVN